MKLIGVFILAAVAGLAQNGTVMPDLTRTPSVANPDVTQQNIHQTICTSGWTDTMRPFPSNAYAAEHRRDARLRGRHGGLPASPVAP
jgi:hypothetical protein